LCKVKKSSEEGVVSTVVADLNCKVIQAGNSAGSIWRLTESEDLNANLVRFSVGSGVEEHLNDEVDVVILGVSGEGKVVVEGKIYALSTGTLVFVPKGARRSILGTSDRFAYLSIHRNRRGVRIGRRENV
jgi:quercetin dioxygenase-like cupin family protein